MPRFKVTPPAHSLGVQGVEFPSRADGTFDLPGNPVIQASLAEAGYTLEELPDADDVAADAPDALLAARDAEIEALNARVAALLVEAEQHQVAIGGRDSEIARLKLEHVEAQNHAADVIAGMTREADALKLRIAELEAKPAPAAKAPKAAAGSAG